MAQLGTICDEGGCEPLCALCRQRWVWPTTLPDSRVLPRKGIEAMERFYRAIGMPINIHELIGREVTDGEIKEMVRKMQPRLYR